MGSINENQQEQSHLDSTVEASVKKIQELVGKAKSCFFCTKAGSGTSNDVRPMTVQKVDDQSLCWFLSAKDSNKNRAVQDDYAVDLYFQAPSHSGFLHLSGVA